MKDYYIKVLLFILSIILFISAWWNYHESNVEYAIISFVLAIGIDFYIFKDDD